MSLTFLRKRLSELFAVLSAQRNVWIFALVLLAIDLTFIGLYSVTRGMRALDLDPGFLGRSELRITTEGSYPEVFNYLKTLLIVLVVGRVGRLTGQRIYYALAFLYGLILLDDSLAIHESVGELLVDTWSLGPLLGVRPQDQGELLAWAFLGAIVVPVLAWGFWRARRSHAELGAILLLPVAGLLFFAIGVDVSYGLLKDAFPGAGLLLDSIEDGGEMITTTAACALAFAVMYLVPSLREP